MALLLLRTLTIVPLVIAVVAANGINSCSNPPTTNKVLNAVCSFGDSDGDLNENSDKNLFKSETKAHHNVSVRDPLHNDDSIQFVHYFSQSMGSALCDTACEGVSRENVTWCVRIADPSRYIETCVHLDENGELEFESTCDAQSLNLEQHLSLPPSGRFLAPPGILGLKNIDWFFKDAYLTCIAETETCRDVTFSSLWVFSSTRNRPPSFVELTESPLVVQPSSTIIIHANIISSSVINSLYWSHNGVNITTHTIREDPLCDSGEVYNCVYDTHPDIENRIRSYIITRILSQDCLGGPLFTTETYIFIENSTKSDEGLYSVSVSSMPAQQVYQETGEIAVKISCDDTIHYNGICSELGVFVEKGGFAEWNCEFSALPGAIVGAVVNENNSSSPLTSYNPIQDPSVSECHLKTPGRYYYVEEDAVDICYSRYTVHIVLCSVNTSGDYYVTVGEERILDWSNVSVFSHSCDNNTKYGCSGTHYNISEGKDSELNCTIRLIRSQQISNISVLHSNYYPVEFLGIELGLGNSTIETNLSVVCASGDPKAIYYISLIHSHFCYTYTTVHIILCSAVTEMTGQFSFGADDGTVLPLGEVNVTQPNHGPSSGTERVSAVVYTISIAILILCVIVL